MAAPGAFSWNSELPSGRNPFWVRDDGLAGLGLQAGDAVSVDTRAEPANGDLVVAEAEIDGDSVRLARRYFAVADDTIRLEPVRVAAPPDPSGPNEASAVNGPSDQNQPNGDSGPPGAGVLVL
ncbi:MAG TPA: hypothetical protein VGE94_00400, partial [Chloroflexota bacterium]